MEAKKAGAKGTSSRVEESGSEWSQTLCLNFKKQFPESWMFIIEICKSDIGFWSSKLGQFVITMGEWSVTFF